MGDFLQRVLKEEINRIRMDSDKIIITNHLRLSLQSLHSQLINNHHLNNQCSRCSHSHHSNPCTKCKEVVEEEMEMEMDWVDTMSIIHQITTIRNECISQNMKRR